MNVLIYVFLGIGALFNGLGAVALIRFPDVYTRIHGATKCTTFGSIFSILGVVVYGAVRGGPVGYGMVIRALLALVFLPSRTQPAPMLWPGPRIGRGSSRLRRWWIAWRKSCEPF